MEGRNKNLPYHFYCWTSIRTVRVKWNKTRNDNQTDIFKQCLKWVKWILNLEKFFFDSLKEIPFFLGMTTIKHIYHPITALILLIFKNADWFYHIFWRHLIKRIISIRENTICANSLTYILVLETEKLLFIIT